jgi:hypothetical protein
VGCAQRGSFEALKTLKKGESMFARLRLHVSQNVVAYLALFVALGGTGAIAATSACTGGLPCVNSDDIINGQVKTGDLGSGAVTTDKLIKGGVTADKLGKDSVSSVKVADNTLASTDILNGAVTSIDILNGSLTGIDISQSLTGADVADNSLSAADIGAGAVASSEVFDNSLTGNDVNESTLTGVVQGTGKVFAGSGAVPNGGASNLVTVPSIGTFALSCNSTEVRFTPAAGVTSYRSWFDGVTSSGVIPVQAAPETSTSTKAFTIFSGTLAAVVRLRIVRSGALMATLELDVDFLDDAGPCHHSFQVHVTS